MPIEFANRVGDQLLSLPSTCREVYHETNVLTFAINAFCLRPGDLSNFVETVPERICVSIQELRIRAGYSPGDSGFREQKDSFIVLKHFPALQTIMLFTWQTCLTLDSKPE